MEETMWLIRWVLTALVIILILGFSLQNQQQTASVQFLNWKSGVMPLYLLLYLAFCAGFLLSVLVSAVHVLNQKREIHRLHKTNRRIKEELDRLRNIHIEEEIEPSDLDETNRIEMEEDDGRGLA
jgi:uncharacterized integral membrane protein